MHIALVIDPERMALDGSATERLAVALASEGARVTRIVPPTAADVPGSSRLIPIKTLDFDGSLLFRRSRLGAVLSSMEEDKPDVFVSFGARAFAAAAALAEDLSAALIAMIASEDELTRTPLRKWVSAIDCVGVSTAPLVSRTARAVPESLISVLPLGVAVPSRPVPPAPQSIAIAGSARDTGAYSALFAAIADVSSALPDLQVAIEFPPGHDVRLWPLARHYKIQSILNGVRRLEEVRPLALSCGVLAVPEPIRGTRTVVLEAMASGRLVVAMEDSLAHYMIDGVTALVATERDARMWTELLTRALLDERTAAPIRAEAAVRVAAMYGSSRCADQLLEACTAAVRGPALPFTAAAP